MNRDQKAAVVDQVATQIQESEAVFAVDYRGISVQQVAELRRRLGEADATLRVVKNTLTERAAEKAGAESLKALLDGPTAFTFVRGDAAMAAKAIAGFRREHSVPEFKGGTMDGAALSIEELQAIALLPARDVLHGQLVGMLASPVTGLVRGLNQLIQGLALQLGQIVEQGLVSGEAPAATEAPPAREETPAEDAPAAAGEAPAAEDAPAAGDAATDDAPAAEAAEAPAPAADEAAAGAEDAAAATPEAPAEDAPPSEDPPSTEDAPAEDAPPPEDASPAAEATAEDAGAAEASGDEPAENDENETPAEGDEEAKEG